MPEMSDFRWQDDIYQISELLNTGLDRETLIAAINCIELGANPQAVAKLIRDVKLRQPNS
ncbi:unnamed protein product [Oikopleura dioica]|uniref:Mitotic-spindle organizing protein 1 n=1 Tax=Oikopleura dioica TaxID=34765 RepID=E4XG63_OIKDI|nr:unnamed protein product [Oikopleura dioica]CBY38697.1 unnamed protein product [Oikopleura dioica]